MNCTETIEGRIPHLRLSTDMGVIHAPVKLVVETDIDGGRSLTHYRRMSDDKPLPVPLRRDGKLVYAIPGGGERRA